MPKLDEPKRISLANTPTRLDVLSKMHGIEFFMKRDDQTGSALSGNKIRKLEFLLADAKAQGCDIVITAGGEQSNHCRATAIAARQVGLDCHLLLRIQDRANPPKIAKGNVLLDKMVGAHIQWIDHNDWKERAALFENVSTKLKSEGRHPYAIPVGGSNALGSWGYIRCAEELDAQLKLLPAKATTVLYACGSGGTGAGLILGSKMLGWAERGINVVGINVSDSAPYFVSEISQICADFKAAHPTAPNIEKDDIHIMDGYVGEGYSLSTPAELKAIRDLAQREGVFLDPVYTGKAYFGMLKELKLDASCFGERVVFLHTGGIFGLFAKEHELSELF